MGEPPPLKVDIARGADGTTVVTVVGDLDFAGSPRLVDDLLPCTGDDLVIDMAGVSFCDSSGLNCLVRLHKAAEAAGGSVRLTRLTRPVAKIITIVSLDDLLVISPDRPPDAAARP